MSQYRILLTADWSGEGFAYSAGAYVIVPGALASARIGAGLAVLASAAVAAISAPAASADVFLATTTAKLGRIADIRDFDVSTAHDSTAAVQLAVDQAATAGATLRSWKAIVPISAPITIRTGTRWDAGELTLKLSPGSNCDILVSEGAYSLFGTGSYGGVADVALADLYGDGDMANQTPTNPDACNGLAYYGAKPMLRNVRMRRIRGNGYRTEWGAFGEPAYGMEGHLYGLVADTCGRRGWWNKGPHDTVTHATHIIDASQEADNTYEGYYSEGYSTAKHFGFHGWHRSTVSARVKHQASSGARTRWINPEFEGGRSQYIDRGVGDRLTLPEFYGHFGGADSAMATISGDTHMAGPRFDGDNAGAFYGLQIGTAGAAAALWLVRDALMYNFCLRSPVRIVNDAGYGELSGRGYSAWDGTAGPWSFPGTPGSQTKLRYIQGGNPYNVSVG